MAVNLDFLDPEPLLFHSSSYLFQTHYFSENLVVPGTEPENSGSIARNSDQ
jgi:hypothetical protein